METSVSSFYFGSTKHRTEHRGYENPVPGTAPSTAILRNEHRAPTGAHRYGAVETLMETVRKAGPRFLGSGLEEVGPSSPLLLRLMYSHIYRKFPQLHNLLQKTLFIGKYYSYSHEKKN